jgi:putative membrane protein
MVDHYQFTPYCGAPPAAATLLTRWNLDPALLAVLLGVVVAYAVFSGPRLRGWRRVSLWRRTCFYGGWALGSAALVSPLCALSVSLFSARIGQHMLLETGVAPLVALGIPRSGLGGRRTELLAAGAFTAALWFWHAPGPYTATFQSVPIYWLMHATTFGAALWLWRAVLDAPLERFAATLAATLATSLQMALLGAILTFAARPLYAPHALTTVAWSLTPLADQQLGGVIMWVPAGVIFVTAIMVSLAAVMRRPGSGAAAPFAT